MKLVINSVLAFVLTILSSSAYAGIFSINLTFNDNVSGQYKSLFEQAADEWESYIIGTPGDYDVQLDVTSSMFTGSPFGVLASAGWRSAYHYDDYVYATNGVMNFDDTDIGRLYNNGTLYAVILHEMAHAIGYGTLWDTSGLGISSLAQNVVQEFTSGSTSTIHYVGQYALDIYQEIWDSSANYVPLETSGGAGTAGSHWDENWMGASGTNALMTGYLSASPILTDVTIASFADIGYVVQLQDGRILGVVSAPTTLLITLSCVVLLLRRTRKDISMSYSAA